MSWQNCLDIDIPSPIIRDSIHPEYNQSADVIVDCWNKGMVGLDMLLHNRGTTALICEVNHEIVKSVPAGAVFKVNDQNIGLVKVDGTGTFLYDLIVTGVSRAKLRRMGVLKGGP